MNMFLSQIGIKYGICLRVKNILMLEMKQMLLIEVLGDKIAIMQIIILKFMKLNLSNLVVAQQTGQIRLPFKHRRIEGMLLRGGIRYEMK